MEVLDLDRILELPSWRGLATALGPTSAKDSVFRRQLALPTTENTVITGGLAKDLTEGVVRNFLDGECHEVKHLPLPSRGAPSWNKNRAEMARLLGGWFTRCGGLTATLHSHEVEWGAEFLGKTRMAESRYVTRKPEWEAVDSIARPVVELRFAPCAKAELGLPINLSAFDWIGEGHGGVLPQRAMLLTEFKASYHGCEIVGPEFVQKLAPAMELDLVGKKCHELGVHASLRRFCRHVDGSDSIAEWTPEANCPPRLWDLHLVKATVWRPNPRNPMSPEQESVTFALERQTWRLAYVSTRCRRFAAKVEFPKSALVAWAREVLR
jgi:hypothetical protein